MSNAVHPKDRVAVVAAYLSPLVGVPLLGPWVLSAVIAEDSTARPHVGRAFDLHLAAFVGGVVLAFAGIAFFDHPAYYAILGGLVLLVAIADLLLLYWALRGTPRSRELWEPIVLGRRKFYRQEPFIG
jgi:hypothetical protein